MAPNAQLTHLGIYLLSGDAGNAPDGLDAPDASPARR